MNNFNFDSINWAEEGVYLAVLTPELAARLIACNADNQRPPKPGVVSDYAKELVSTAGAGLCGEALDIKIDRNGRMINGQHTCLAVVKAGIAPQLKVSIRTGCHPSSITKIDAGASRTARDAAATLGLQLGSKVITALELLELGAKGWNSPSPATPKGTRPARAIEHIKMWERWRSGFHPIWSIDDHIRGQSGYSPFGRADNAPAIAAAVLATVQTALREKEVDDIRHWAAVACNGSGACFDTSPLELSAIRFREATVMQRKRTTENYRIAVVCLYRGLRGEHIRQLKGYDHNPFLEGA